MREKMMEYNMSEKKILHITRNIPVKGLKGNDIIFKIADGIKNKNIKQSFLFPAEYIPKLPGLSSRAKIFSMLKGSCITKYGFVVDFYNYIRLPFRMNFYLSDYDFFNTLHTDKYIGYDVIHAHYIMPDGIIAKKISEKNNLKYIITVRQGDINRLSGISKNGSYFNKYRSVIANAAGVISPSKSIHDAVLKYFNINSTIIPHGIDKNIIKIPKEGIGETVNVVVCSQLIEQKNVDWVINVIMKLIAKNHSIKLNVVGDGPLKNKLIKMANGQENITFHGWQSRDYVYKELQKNDIFIMPSDNETFGMAYLEAVANGCLIIGRKNTGVDGFFKHGETAFFVSSQQDLYEQILYLLADKAQIIKVRNNATKYLCENLTWDNIIEKYLDVYKF